MDSLSAIFKMKIFIAGKSRNCTELYKAFNINKITIINTHPARPTSIIYRPHMDHIDTRIIMEAIENPNMWFIIFDTLCCAILVPEASLRKFNFFDAFIRALPLQQPPEKNHLRFANGAHIYILNLANEPFTQIMYYSSVESIAHTFEIIYSKKLCEIPPLYNFLDYHLIEALSGIKNLEISDTS